MRRKNILLAGALLACLTASAQVGEYRNKWDVGFNGGINLNKVGFKPKIKQGYEKGVGFGAMVRYTSEKYFKAVCSLQMEVNYNQWGFSEIIDEGTYSYSRRMDYVQIPLMARMAWGKEEKGAQFFFNAGPYANFLLSETESRSGDFTDATNYEYSHLADKTFDYGILAGMGAEVNTGIGRFDVEARYDYGLGNLYDNSKKGYFSISNNAAIQVRIAYWIPVKK